MRTDKKGMKLKRRLLYMMICIAWNITGMYIGGKAIKKARLNTSRNFGTTHFIIGYDEKQCVPEQTLKSNRFHKKQKDSIDKSSTFIDENRVIQSFFTTEQDLSPILLEIMNQVKKRLYIAAFSLTDKRIVDCIVQAHKNGVDICVITDANNMKQAYSKIQYLINHHISVLYYDPNLNPRYKKGIIEPCMHHKFIIVDDRVVTGSANFTKSGQTINIENIIILKEEITTKEYLAEVERLKKLCVECVAQA